MASIYVYSGAAGAGTGADWANAYTTLTAAIAGGAAGDTYYVAHDHAESTAGAVTLSWKGTPAAPDRCLCVNRAGTVPPVAADLRTTATVTTTGANAFASAGGSLYCYGVNFMVGTGASAASGTYVATTIDRKHVYESCTFGLATTSGTSANIFGGTSGDQTELINCSVSFGLATQDVRASTSGLTWRNNGTAAVTGATLPTLFSEAPGRGEMLFSGLDLSNLGSGKTLVQSSAGTLSKATFRNCKLDAAVTIASGAVGPSATVDLIGCGATGVSSRNERHRYQGVLTTETTIVRTSGASDGTTPYSWKIVTTANNKRDFPFECFDLSIMNEAVAAPMTLTVHTVTDNVTLTDAEIWLEAAYLGSAATPIVSRISDANATVLTTAANQASDSGTAWTTTGLTTPLKQKLEVTFTPEMAGVVRFRVKIAKASTTVYVCPLAELV